MLYPNCELLKRIALLAPVASSTGDFDEDFARGAAQAKREIARLCAPVDDAFDELMGRLDELSFLPIRGHTREDDFEKLQSLLGAQDGQSDEAISCFGGLKLGLAHKVEALDVGLPQRTFSKQWFEAGFWQARSRAQSVVTRRLAAVVQGMRILHKNCDVADVGRTAELAGRIALLLGAETVSAHACLCSEVRDTLIQGLSRATTPAEVEKLIADAAFELSSHHIGEELVSAGC